MSDLRADDIPQEKTAKGMSLADERSQFLQILVPEGGQEHTQDLSLLLLPSLALPAMLQLPDHLIAPRDEDAESGGPVIVAEAKELAGVWAAHTNKNRS